MLREWGGRAGAARSECARAPNHSRKAPSTTSVAEWPRISFTRPVVGSKRPMRGPTTHAPHSAAMPPTMCTTPEPA